MLPTSMGLIHLLLFPIHPARKRERESKQTRKGASYQMVVIAGFSSSFISDASLLEKNDL